MSSAASMTQFRYQLPPQLLTQLLKLAKLTFNTRNNSAPFYLTCLVYDYVPGRSLRSNHSNLLTVPSCKLKLWYSQFPVLQLLLFGTLLLQTYNSFTRHLKTFYFNTVFNECLLLGHLVTDARASDSMFLFIDFVRVTNCFLRLRLHKPHYLQHM